MGVVLVLSSYCDLELYRGTRHCSGALFHGLEGYHWYGRPYRSFQAVGYESVKGTLTVSYSQDSVATLGGAMGEGGVTSSLEVEDLGDGESRIKLVQGSADGSVDGARPQGSELSAYEEEEQVRRMHIDIYTGIEAVLAMRMCIIYIYILYIYIYIYIYI